MVCPAGGLCPGGSRLWARVGYWVPSEAGAAVLPCAPPAPTAKCLGWNVTAGAAQCGPGYRQGSYLCSACATGFFPDADGSCTPCPAISGAWDRYRGLVVLLGGVLAAALCVGLALVALVRAVGGTVAGSAALLFGLVLWSVVAVQARGLAREGEDEVAVSSTGPSSGLRHRCVRG